MPLAEISTALASLKTATEIAKYVKDASSSLEQAETDLKIAELISNLVDARMEMADVQDLVLVKDKTIAELNERLEIKAKMHWDKPYYWRMDRDTKDGPYCQLCYDNGGNLIRLQESRQGQWKCQKCSNTVTDSSYVSPRGVGLRRY